MQVSLIIGLLLFVVGSLIYWLAPRVGPNPIFGVRVGYSFASREVWDRTNRVGGILVAVTGIGVALLGILLRLLGVIEAMTTGIVIGAMLAALVVDTLVMVFYARRHAQETLVARRVDPVEFQWIHLAPIFATCALLVLLGVYYYPLLPADRVATHFDLNGQPNDWMSRDMFYLVFLGLSAIFLLINTLVVFVATREPLIAFARWGSRWRLDPRRGLIYIGLSLGMGNLILSLALFDIGWFNTHTAHPFPVVVFLVAALLLIAILVVLFFVLGRSEAERAENIQRLKPWIVRDGRLRSGWRIAAYLGASLLSLMILGLAFLLLIGFVLANRGLSSGQSQALIEDFSLKPFHYPDVALTFELLRALFALGLIWSFRRWVDKRSLRDLGFQLSDGWHRELGAGFAYAMVGWVVIFVLSLLFGGAAVVGFAWDRADAGAVIGGLALGLFFNLLVGIVEESDARGYVMQNLAEGIRLIPAILVSSFYFGVLHLLNPGAGWLSTLGIFISGVMLAIGYYVTRRLWFSIGMHAAWNFAEGPIFGFPVSGLDMGGLLQLRITGAEWLTGGAFGPEAGALAVLVEIAMIVGLIVWLRRKEWGVEERAKLLFKSALHGVQRIREARKI